MKSSIERMVFMTYAPKLKDLDSGHVAVDILAWIGDATIFVFVLCISLFTGFIPLILWFLWIFLIRRRGHSNVSNFSRSVRGGLDVDTDVQQLQGEIRVLRLEKELEELKAQRSNNSNV